MSETGISPDGKASGAGVAGGAVALPAYPFTRPAPLEAPEQYAHLRAAGPTRVRLPFGSEPLLLTSYEDVRAALAEPLMSSDVTTPGLPRVSSIPSGPNQMSFLRLDDPEHNRLRRMIIPEFTLRRVTAMRPAIEEVVDRLLDRVEAAGPPTDLYQSFALPLPVLVLGRVLGVPAEDQDFLAEISAVIFDASVGPARVGEAFQSITAYVDRLISSLPAGATDSVLARLATQYAAAGELTHQEFVAMARMLILAAHESTAKSITLAVLTLLRHPDQLAEVRAVPGLLSTGVHELLRLAPTAQYGPIRAAADDVEINGCPITRGDGVIVSLTAANRDPDVFPDPDVLDLHRDATREIAFGHGVHLCIGKHLALVELEVALERLFLRFPGLRLAVDFADLSFAAPESFTYGTTDLPITW